MVSPSVFVPYPQQLDDHQTANAHYLADVGAAKICPQATLSPESLTTLLQPMMSREILMTMAVKARQQAQTQATSQVADLIEALS
uniref:CAZy families GT28 protein n=1 Tax=uncultured Acinetobacter sp. TaxID=165433 RepID=A0A060CF92_9GAMM|nr:CAZy families GT28 protein [uncultured Acinetobacter sp.]